VVLFSKTPSQRCDTQSTLSSRARRAPGLFQPPTLPDVVDGRQSTSGRHGFFELMCEVLHSELGYLSFFDSNYMWMWWHAMNSQDGEDTRLTQLLQVLSVVCCCCLA
jgi:hypothetical protein